jgi:hypothetical protein
VLWKGKKKCKGIVERRVDKTGWKKLAKTNFLEYSSPFVFGTGTNLSTLVIESGHLVSSWKKMGNFFFSQ